MQSIYLAFYRMPFSVLAAVTAAILLITAAAHVFLKKNIKRDVGGVAATFAFLLVLYVTVFSRSEVVEDMVLTPGYSLMKAFHSAEYLRMVLMNIFLFVPFGAFVSLSLGGKKAARVTLTTLASALALTVIIETVQYLFRLGCAETDDVICNVLGAAIGLIPYFATYRFVKRRSLTC